MIDDIKKIEEEKKKLKELELFQQYSGEDEIITSAEAWASLEEERKKPTVKFFTKIPTLDKMLDGFRQGDIVVISAPTKQGKTTLAQTFTHNLSASEVPCLWFQYELTQMEFLEKFGENMPNFTLPKRLKANSLKWVEERIMESISKYGTKVVFIDHLHYLLDMNFIGQRGNVSLLIGAIMRGLKQIALKWNITIVLIAHTTKLRFESKPDLADIRDSSFISQEADTVLMIWRKRQEKTDLFDQNRAGVAVMANRRNGKVGTMGLLMKNNQFYEETKIYGENNHQ